MSSPDPSTLKQIISFADSSFVDLGPHVSQLAVLQIVQKKGDVIVPLGTCFAITNDGLCMTARHVLEDALLIKEGTTPSLNLDPERHGVFGALYLSNQPNPDNPTHVVGGILPISRFHVVNGIDIALIKLELPHDSLTGERLHFPAHRLRLSTPGVGEVFFGLGYRAMQWKTDFLGTYNVDHRYSATRGEVEEIHPGGRDSLMLPYPCFRTSARFDSGMSGGPLMDHAGRVFGVVCSSYGMADEEEGHVSYGSLIAPSMVMSLGVSDAGGQQRSAFLWELVQGGAISADTRGIEITATATNIRMSLNPGLILNAQLNG